jgi:hypothetical protein
MNNTNIISRPRWPFQRRSNAWLPTFLLNLVAVDVSPLHPRLPKEVRADSRRLLPFVDSMRRALLRATFALCLLGGMLTARGQDPIITNTNYPVNRNVSLGAPVSFRVFANSTNPPITFQWQHEGTNLPAATNATLVISNLTVADAGGYMATVSNASGAYTNTRTAILTVDPTFTQIIAGPLVTDVLGGWSACWVDYDGDGKLDVTLCRQPGFIITRAAARFEG